MRVLVTGAGGFIGRYLTQALLRRGEAAGPDGALARLRSLNNSVALSNLSR